MNQAKTTTKTFTFVYKTTWTKEELLKNFINKLKQDSFLIQQPALFPNLNGKIEPILKRFKIFADLNFHVQSYMSRSDLPAYKYPLFLALAYALEVSYAKYHSILCADRLLVIFHASWEILLHSNSQTSVSEAEIELEEEKKWKQEKELPFNDKLQWFDLLEPMDQNWQKYIAKLESEIYIDETHY